MARRNSTNRSQSNQGHSQNEQRGSRNGAGRPDRRRSNRSRRSSESRQASSPSTGWNSLGLRAVETVREHPIPAALIGAGLAWMLLETKQARNLENRLGEALSEYAGTARDAVGGVAGYIGESIGSLAAGGAHAGESARDTITGTFERHPLAVCAAVLAAGVAAGMMLPATTAENSLLGRSSDALTRSIRTRGSALIEQGRSLASSAAQSVAGAVGLGSSGSRGTSASRSRGGSGSRGKSKRRRTGATRSD